MMETLPAVLGEIAKPEGVLKAIYKDLASPGVKQVGRALETVLQTGNIVLLPLRMLNEFAANFERRNFEQIADRFSNIPEGDIVDVRPEIGVPILEKLSATQDPDLRHLFIELLATAADREKVTLAHPSYVRVIESLSPDEAHILKEWKGKSLFPSMSVTKVGKASSSVTLRDLVVVPPSGVAVESMLSVYVANMAGLGLLTVREGTYLADEEAYEPLINIARKDFPEIKNGSLQFSISSESEKLSEGDVVYNKGCIEILSYGRVFQHACIG
jgi:hypothetical protein